MRENFILISLSYRKLLTIMVSAKSVVFSHLV